MKRMFPEGDLEWFLHFSGYEKCGKKCVCIRFKFKVNCWIFLCKMFIQRIIEINAIMFATFFSRKYFGEKGNHFMFVRMLQS